MTPKDLPDEFRTYSIEYKQDLVDRITILNHISNEQVIFMALAAIMDEQYRQAHFNLDWPLMSHTALRTQIKERY